MQTYRLLYSTYLQLESQINSQSGALEEEMEKEEEGKGEEEEE